MGILSTLFYCDMKRRMKDGFILGYNIIFPTLMIFLLGYLTSGSYGKEFTGYHYYSLVMPPFCCLMTIITAAYAGKDEAYKKTAERLLTAPISKTQIVLSKLFSCTILISFSNLIVISFAWIAFRLPLQQKLGQIMLLLTAETLCVCAIGLYIGLGMRNFILVKNTMNLPIFAAAILGGTFYPLGTFDHKLELLFRISPLTWINRSIRLSLYDGRDDLLIYTSLCLILTGLGFTLLAICSFRKEEFIHGDLPGYDK